MSRFRDEFAVAFDELVEEQGDPFVYTPVDDVPRTITAPIFRASTTVRNESLHDVTNEIVKVFAKKGSTDGVLIPQRGDVIEWDGVTWGFLSSRGDAGDVWELWFQRIDVNTYGSRPDRL